MVWQISKENVLRNLSLTFFFSFRRMLKELKAPQKDSTAWCSQSDRLQMAEDTLAAVRRVRREVGSVIISRMSYPFKY